MVALLAKHLPRNFSKDTVYREPFFGAGSLFFHLQPKEAYLSDANADLMHFFKCLKQRPDVIASYMSAHANAHSKKYYYFIRNRFNRRRHSLAQAARFLYLNQANFNGIYRVNKDGKFNVPFGYKRRGEIKWPSPASLTRQSASLEGASIRAVTFERSISAARRGEFVFIDPPYPPLNKTSFFTHYTKDRFSFMDQQALALACSDLDRIGVKFMVTNADTRPIRQLYSQFEIRPLLVTRYVTCQKKNYASELIITNYQVDR